LINDRLGDPNHRIIEIGLIPRNIPTARFNTLIDAPRETKDKATKAKEEKEIFHAIIISKLTWEVQMKPFHAFSKKKRLVFGAS
jgi:hypothetical protein